MWLRFARAVSFCPAPRGETSSLAVKIRSHPSLCGHRRWLYDAQPFGFDAEVEQAGTTARERLAHGRRLLRGRETEQTTPATRAAHLRRLGPGSQRACNQIVDDGCRDPGR